MVLVCQNHIIIAFIQGLEYSLSCIAHQLHTIPIRLIVNNLHYTTFMLILSLWHFSVRSRVNY